MRHSAIENQVDEIVAEFGKNRGALITLLQKVQERWGYLPRPAIERLAAHLSVPVSEVMGALTFYAQFRFMPIGKKHVMVCRGTSCHVRGAQRILDVIERRLGIKEGQTTPDREYSLETVACIGACGLSPCIMVNRKVEASLTPKKVTEFFSRGALS